MDLKVNATMHLKPADVEAILKEYLEAKTGRTVGKITFNVHSASDDRFHYSPAGLTDVNVEIKL